TGIEPNLGPLIWIVFVGQQAKGVDKWRPLRAAAIRILVVVRLHQRFWFRQGFQLLKPFQLDRLRQQTPALLTATGGGGRSSLKAVSGGCRLILVDFLRVIPPTVGHQAET